MKAVSTIDEYIAGFPKETQVLLQQMRMLIQQSAPDAHEVITYAMPTFRQEGNLVHFAGYNKHIGFYPAPSAIIAFSDELSNYVNSKGAVQFPLDKPLPVDLIQRMVQFRVAENVAKAALKKSQRTCPQGHKYSKTSDCPTCPVCEQLRKPSAGFLAGIGVPARRALEREGIHSLEQLAKYSEVQLLALHGLGKSSLPKLQAALTAVGKTLKK
jgi:uncharacterized protein YdhG (YjbR/CyaY superfamily)